MLKRNIDFECDEFLLDFPDESHVDFFLCLRWLRAKNHLLMTMVNFFSFWWKILNFSFAAETIRSCMGFSRCSFSMRGYSSLGALSFLTFQHEFKFKVYQNSIEKSFYGVLNHRTSNNRAPVKMYNLREHDSI